MEYSLTTLNNVNNVANAVDFILSNEATITSFGTLHFRYVHSKYLNNVPNYAVLYI